jgi:adenylate cyclase, class 2
MLYPIELRARAKYYPALHRLRTGSPDFARAAAHRILSDMTGPIETEIKLPMKDGAGPALLLLERHGYRMTVSRTLQVDQVFDFPDGALRESGRLLRLRLEKARLENAPSENGAAILTYKGPVLSAGLHKSREELETSVADGGTLEKVIERLGFVPSFRYEKYRTTFRASGEPGLVALDETPIGVFLELEGPPYWIDGTALRLGFAPRDYVTASYSALYRVFRESHEGPPDMLFGEEP